MNHRIPDENLLSLKTARLSLEPITVDHAEELHQFFNDERLHTFVNFKPLTLEEQQLKCARWETRQSPDKSEIWLNWAARDTLTKKFVGHFQSGIKQDGITTIGYVVAVEFQRKGLATEALRRIFKFLQFEMKVREIKAFSDTRNLASHRLSKKLAMTQVDLIKNADTIRGEPSDEFVFAITLPAK